MLCTVVEEPSSGSSGLDDESPAHAMKIMRRSKDFSITTEEKPLADKRSSAFRLRNPIMPGSSLWEIVGGEKHMTYIPSGESERPKQMLPEDIYSLIYTADPNSKPFILAILILFLFQMFMIALTLYDLFDIDSENPARVSPELQSTLPWLSYLASSWSHSRPLGLGTLRLESSS